MVNILAFVGPLVVVGGVLLLSSVRIIMEYERAVLFTFGKYSKMLNPGLNIIIPIVQSMQKVDIRTKAVDVPKQEVMTKDNVPVSVNAVVYMRVQNPEKAILKIQNYIYAVAQYGQTALRDVIGNKELDFVLTEREKIADEIKEFVDKETDEWGIDITSIRIQDISLPENMKRVMARQAEAEREKRATIIKAQGETIAAHNLSKAANTLSESKGALYLRTLQTLADISADPSQKIIIPLPVELLKMFEGYTKTESDKKKVKKLK